MVQPTNLDGAQAGMMSGLFLQLPVLPDGMCSSLVTVATTTDTVLDLKFPEVKNEPD